MIWPHASAKHPCPICHGTDWCSFGDKAVICRRTVSERPHIDGTGNTDGWYHRPDGGFVPRLPKVPPPPRVNPATVKTTVCGEDLAIELGVSLESLRLLGVGWSNEHNAWMFPMRNGKNEIVGYNRRFKNGEKKMLAGTKAGLYIPQTEPHDLTVICEGGSDTAALLDLGFFGLGRFNVMTGAVELREFFRIKRIWKCVIIADNDEKKSNGQRPGIEGAAKLKKDLGISSVIWMPPTPCKDLRDFVKNGGTKKIIMSDINQMIWTKK